MPPIAPLPSDPSGSAQTSTAGLPATSPSSPSSPARWAFWPLGLLMGVALVGTAIWWMAPPVARTPEQLLSACQDAYRRRDFDTLGKLAETLVRAAPEDPRGWKALAEATARTDQRERSIEALEQLAKQQPRQAAPLAMQLGQKWMVDNQIRAALKALRIAERCAPGAPEPYRLQAQITSIMGRPREVVRCLIELIKRRSVTQDDLAVVTSINAVISDPPRLQKILETDPASRLEMLIYVMDDITLNRTSEAIQRLEEIAAAHPEDYEARGLLGELYAEQDREFLEWQQGLPPEADAEPHVWVARAKWLRQAGRIDSAIRCLQEAFLREPEHLTTNFLLGQLLTAQGEKPLGEEFTERARRLQRIVDWNSRLNDRDGQDRVRPMITELEATGRLWEAWAWSIALDSAQPARAGGPSATTLRLEKKLNSALPRTDPAVLPGRDFDWQRYPLPNWKEFTSPTREAPAPQSTPPSSIQFADRGLELGLTMRYVNSIVPEKGRKIYETMGAGVGAIDFDMDGWPDLYFGQGNTSVLHPTDEHSDVLYRNLQGERFLDVSASARIHEIAYSQGVAVGDFDGDGFPDVYIANLGRNTLYQNNGDGTFTDVTARAGLKQTLWTVSCAIADLNGDGLPELFDVNYVQGDKLIDGVCYDANGRPGVCRPVVFDPATDTVSLNQGDGTFVEQQGECGLDLPQGMSLGIVIADFSEDNRPDIFIANDMTANFLLVNQQTSPADPLHFIDEAFARGVALDQQGLAQACMGVACADVNRDGQPDLFITNFAREYDAFYRSQPGGLYQDDIRAAGLSEATFDPLGFGAQFLDADHDGWHDLVYLNGHIDEIVGEPFRMRTQLFRGLPNGTFQELFAAQAGPLFDQTRLGRGLVTLDWNRDGRLDFAASDLEESILLGENQTPDSGHALRLRLVGTESSRDAYGAKVRVHVSAGDERVVQLTAGNGYESTNQRLIEVGLGTQTSVEQVEIRWPSGRVQTQKNVAADQAWLVVEGREGWLTEAR